MDADSKRFMSTLRSRSEKVCKYTKIRYLSQDVEDNSSEILMSSEEIDGDDDFQEEFPCPFCAESYDIIGLCCHIDDEHTLESRNAVCPVCSVKVGVDMVVHITLQHGSLFKRKQMSQKSRSLHSRLSLLQKELREGNLQRLLGIPSRNGTAASNVTPDPLLSSFVGPTRSHLPPVMHQTKKISEKKQLERNRQVGVSPVSTKDREEQTERSEFIQRLLTSAILDEV